MSPRQIALPCAACLLLSAAWLLTAVGCYNPYMYQRNPYGQPVYAPPQNLAPTAPGTLYIPQTNAPPYDPANPGSTYDNDRDTFQRSPDNNGSGSFYDSNGTDGGVPRPRDLNKDDMFNSDLGPSTQVTPSSNPTQPSADATLTADSTC